MSNIMAAAIVVQNSMEQVRMSMFRKKPNLDPVHVERDEVEADIRQQAAKVARLQDKMKSHTEIDSALFNETQATVVGMELDAAERVFFTLFNRLRTLYDLVPLESDAGKFTGEFNYSALI